MKKYLDFKNNINDIDLKEVATALKSGKIAVFPTETVYGIGTNGLDEAAIKKLYAIKERPLNKPISLLVSNIDMINSVAQEISEIEYKLIEKFFPGPLTIILKKKSVVPDILTANGDTVGIRMPANKIALDLINYAGVPLCTSSANISGRPSETNLQDVKNDFNDEEIDYFIDGGQSKIGVSSTVVQVIDGVPIILRHGSISEDEIKATISC